MIERRKGDRKWEIEGEKKHRTGAAAGPDVVEGQVRPSVWDGVIRPGGGRT